MVKLPLRALVAAFCLWNGFAHAAEPRPDASVSRFVSPPADARIHKIIHGWPDAEEAQDRLIRKLSAQGFGGVVCNVSFDQYLESEKKWTAFTRAVKAAKAAGMALWLYDERGYPSGNAGGLTLRDHPEWEANGFLVSDAETTGGTVKLTVPPGQLWLAAAYPVRDGQIDLAKRVDLTASVNAGELTWQAPTGRWRVLAITESPLFEGTHAAGNLHAKIPYVNLLQPEPTARFLDLTYGAYAARLGPDLGSRFMATFTDEPSLMSWFVTPMPYRPLPWAPNLPTAFAQRRGYPLDRSMVPALVTDAGAVSAKFRYDFWLTVGELVAENFFGQIQQRCRQLQIPSGGHLLAEEGLVNHTPLYGDFFRCIRRLDAPSIDCLTSVPAEVPWHIARLVASAAELENKTLVMCETSDHSQRYRRVGDKRPVRVVTEEEIRGTCNRLIVGGVNDITSYYSFANLTDEQIRRLNEWVGRCCTMLRGGHQVADIAVLYPTESVWTRFEPSRHSTRDAGAAARIESLYRGAADSLFAAQRDFTFVDSRALAEAKVDGDALVHGALRWRVVVLPGADTMPEAAWVNLAKWVRQGGVVIALGSLPCNSERDFPSAQVKAIASEIFSTQSDADDAPCARRHASGGIGLYLPRGLEGLLPQALAGILEPDVRVAGAKSPLRVTHRRNEGHELFFVINDSAQPWEGELTVAAQGAGERWDPATGGREGNVPSRLALKLGPYGATLLRYTAAVLPKRSATSNAALPFFQVQGLPKVDPKISHGEFVRAELAPSSNRGASVSASWRTHAVLTKSNVDTHLFARFHYASPVDLSVADCVAIDSWVPGGQSTPSRLLVILHEEGGGDFLADSGRPLAKSGSERTLIPLSRFHLAGWSKDSDGQLDLSRVSEIRVGWGGYFGTEGEIVEFDIAPPSMGRVVTSDRQ